jgi:hypothetical protein
VKKKKVDRSHKVSKFIYWTPRILSILFLLFLAMFSLDVIQPGLSFWEILGGMLMHNIPTFILLIVLLISWKHEIVGGVAFILAGLAYIIQVMSTVITTGFQWYYITWAIQISGIAFAIGILFLMNWHKKR